MDASRLSNLLFLSGIAAVGIPGCDTDDGDSSTPTSGSATVGGTGDASGSATEGSDGATSTDGATSGPATSGAETGDNGALCSQYASWVSGCDASYDYETALSYCNQLLENIGGDDPACGSAYEELLACAITLDCSTLEQGETPPECQAQRDTFDETCGFGGSTGGTTESGTDGDGTSG